MLSKTLFRLSGAVLLVGALLAALGGLIAPRDLVDGARYLSPLYLPSSILKLFGSLMVLIGLPGMYAYQANRTGKLGLISFVMTFLGLLIVNVSIGALFTFIVPMLAANPATGSPGVLDWILQGRAIGYSAYFLTGILLTILGLLLLGVAILRAKKFARGAGVLIIIGVLLGFGGGFLPWDIGLITEAIGMPLVFLGLAGCGYTLLRTPGVFVPRLDLVVHDVVGH